MNRTDARSQGTSAQDKAIRLGHPSYIWRFGQERRLALIREHAPLDGARILDVGCGLGMYTSKMRAFSAEVYGVDLDADKVSQAGGERPYLTVGRAEELPFPEEYFDVILLHEVLEHVEDDGRAAAEAFRCLKMGGKMVMFAPNRLYPFETHGIYLGGRNIFGAMPLVSYLPAVLRRQLCPHVRAYTIGELRRLFTVLPARVVVHIQIFAGYDRLMARWPFLGTLARRVSYSLERTPLSCFGLSHFLVVEREWRA
jgi:SAM-dependent methyltransferase